MKAIHFFYKGTHTDMNGNTLNFAQSALHEMQESYDPALHEAPLVIGHPDNDAPAFGWVESIEATDEGAFANPKQVEPKFAQIVSEGRYKKISAAIFMPWAKQNPVPGKHYLKHIGFFGGATVALKGLKPIEFQGEDKDVAVIECDVSLFSDNRSKEPMADDATKAALEAENTRLKAELEANKQKQQQTANFAEKQAELELIELELKRQQTAINTKALAAKRDSIAAFVGSFIDKGGKNEGKLLPRHREPLIQVMMQLDKADTLKFGEGVPEQNPQHWMKGFLTEVLDGEPAKVAFGEKAPADNIPAAPTAEKILDLPEGQKVDAESEKVLQQAYMYAAQHKVDINDAIDVVLSGGLKQ